MKVFTVFFCGTKYDRKKSDVMRQKAYMYPMGELISELAENHAGQETMDWMILKGPKISGSGVNKNAKSAFTKITQIYSSYGLDVVNMVGWSRGGITCHILANMISEANNLKNVQINIFTIDPVPGPDNFIYSYKDKASIPSNVKNYMAVYARDERSKSFGPMIPYIVSDSTKVKYIPFPGNHTTVVGNNTPNGEKNTGKDYFLAVGQLVRDQVEKFLTAKNTNLENKLNFDNWACFECYEKIIRNKIAFESLRNYSLAAGLENRGGERLLKVFAEKDQAKPTREKFSDIDSLKPVKVSNLKGMLERLKNSSRINEKNLLTERLNNEKNLLTEHLNILIDQYGNNFLNQHHKDVVFNIVKSLLEQGEPSQVDALNLLGDLSRFSPKRAESKFFPCLESGFNYTFSDDPILLNGMEVIFDQPIPVSPVTLQPKEKRKQVS